jgi:lysophospholipase L1-like esterase
VEGVEGKKSVKDPTLVSWTGDPFYLPAHKAFFFSANVPAGNYSVKITLGSQDTAVRATIRAKQRRLMIEDWQVPAGQTQTREIAVNRRVRGSFVQDSTREGGYVDLDDRLTIEFNGNHPVVTALEITQVDTGITVYLFGNSTCVNQPVEPWSTWGMNFPRFFKPGVFISNQAESGLSASSFLGARMTQVIATIKPGDYLFAEFGHNDAKSATSTANYSANLTTIMKAAQAKGAIGVLVTPTARNFFTGTKADNSLLDPFVAKVKAVAASMNINYLDLSALSISFIEALYPNQKRAYTVFPAHTVPGQLTSVSDGTHWNDYGGYELAKGMATLAKRKNLTFTKFLTDDYVDFDPSKPDPYASFQLPFSPFLGAYVPPDSAVGPNLVPDGLAAAMSWIDCRIEAASFRQGGLTLTLMGTREGDQVRVFTIDGALVASNRLHGGATEDQTISLRNGTSHGVHLVELLRDGRVLDERKILP